MWWWIGGGVLGFLALIVFVVALVNIVANRHRFSSGALAAWLILVLVFPLLGPLVYFLAHGVGGAPTGASGQSPDIDRTPRTGV